MSSVARAWPLRVPEEDVVISLVVPGEPVPFARPRFTPGQTRAYTEEASRNYRDMVAVSILAQRPRAVPDGQSSFGLQAMFFRKSRRRADLDNFLKGVIDACTMAGVWNDDSQLDALLAIMEHDDEPRVQFMAYRRR